MSKKGSQEELVTKEDLEGVRNWINRTSGFMKRWGAIKFLMVFLMLFIVFFASDEQKSEIIDRYILFKGWETNGFQSSYLYVIVLLIITNIATIIFWNITGNLRRAENNRLGKEKSRLQEILAEKALRSSEHGKKNNN